MINHQQNKNSWKFGMTPHMQILFGEDLYFFFKSGGVGKNFNMYKKFCNMLRLTCKPTGTIHKVVPIEENIPIEP